MRKNGLTMVELVIAVAIFAAAAGAIGMGMFSTMRTMSLSSYHYTALNLVRKMAEYGSGTTFGHHTRQLFYFAPAQGNTLAPFPDCPVDGTDGGAGYRLKEWRCFAPSNPGPFDATNMPVLIPDYVPGDNSRPQEQQSVRISIDVSENPSFYNALQENIVLSWVSDGVPHSYSMSLIPVSHVNNVITLNTAQFWWSKS